jgi:hypothetical protein
MFIITLEKFSWFLVPKRSNYKQSETMDFFLRKWQMSELSGDENFDDLGHFNLVNIPRNERADLERQVRDLVGQSDDASDFERFEPEDAYEVPDFDDWEKVENYRNIVEFNERMGPKGSSMDREMLPTIFNFLPTSQTSQTETLNKKKEGLK